MSRIAEVFERCRAEKRAAFIPYLTAGDPSPEVSLELVLALIRAGADIIELGVPFSDPIADGPVNQRSAARALAAGAGLSAVLSLVAEVRAESEIPIVLFSYFNPLQVQGLERTAERAAASGVDGVLCLDLPPAEAAATGYLEALRSRGLETVFLVAPTSDRKRVQEVLAAATGFVYFLPRTGVTGAETAFAKKVLGRIKRLRRKAGLPVAVGFGIATPEQARTVGRVADGVVVGSALVELIESFEDPAELAAAVERSAASLREAMAR